MRFKSPSAKRTELLVRGLFFPEIGVEKADNVVMLKFARPCDQCAVAGNLVVLDRLRTADDRGIEDLLVFDFAGDFIRFTDQAVDGRAGWCP